MPELAQPRALRRPRVVSGIVELPAVPDAAADAPAAAAAVPVRTAHQLRSGLAVGASYDDDNVKRGDLS